ncbi:hypothetical protein QBC45DRAFT_407576 [Copromyces sp. CBS 386.78]|nr:hypothetical protein QBC45DRAFT_407576 [Copromyces sp. CBS 386.78]
MQCTPPLIPNPPQNPSSHFPKKYQPGGKVMFDIAPYLALIHISVVWNQFIWTRPGTSLRRPSRSPGAARVPGGGFAANNTKLGIARWSPPLAVCLGLLGSWRFWISANLLGYFNAR